MKPTVREKNAKSAPTGFTLIEIIAALVVFMIGVMGMVALQGVSIQAAVKSRQQTAAVGIARYLVAELKSEFAAWDRNQGTSFPDEYALLKGTVSSGVVGGAWIQFGGANASGADLRIDELLGHSELSDGSAARFCVAYRVDPIENLPAGAPSTDYSVWQIRVRVSWTKNGYFQSGNIDWTDCSVANVASRIVAVGSDDVVELVSTATREFSK